MVNIEFKNPQSVENFTTKLIRYVAKDGNAYAGNLASFTSGYEDKVVHALVGGRSGYASSSSALKFQHVIIVGLAGEQPWEALRKSGLR